MSEKHTPGPWAACTFQVMAGRDKIAHTGMGNLGPARSHEAEANARLIAAAPELLVALKMLADAADSHIELCDEVEDARAAIAKATTP